MKIHVAFEFESVEEMLDTLGKRTNQVTQAITGTPGKPLAIVKDVEPDADEDQPTPAPRGRVKKAAKKAAKKAPPADEEEEDEEEETPRPKKTVKKGALRDLLDPADDEDDDAADADDDGDEDEEEAPAKVSGKKTLDDVRDACRAFAKQHGPDTLSDVLTEKYDIEALEDLKPSQYNEVIGTLMFYEKPKKGRG